MAKNPKQIPPKSRSKSTRNRLTEAAYISSISIENIRCFGPEQNLHFTDRFGNPARWTIILGNNGTGKTTLLQALALANFRDISKNANIIFEAPELILSRVSGETFTDWFYTSTARDISSESRVSIEGVTGSTLSSQNQKYTKFGVHVESNPVDSDSLKGLSWAPMSGGINSFLNLNISGYGADRKLGKGSIRSTDEDSIGSLFDEDAKLRNAEEWLLQADYAASRNALRKKKEIDYLDKVQKALISLLPDITSIRFRDTEVSHRIPIVEFNTPYGWVPLNGLSFGYKTLIAWTVDFASRMFDRYPGSKNPMKEPAVVLVDEIDLHLHPKWQRSIMSYLSELFPNTQFIATAHSPLVVQAAGEANIAVFRREGDHVVIDQSVSAIRGWRIDQVLTSDLFGLETARPPELEPLLEERTRLLGKSRMTKKDRERVAELEERIGDLPTGERQEDIEAMDIIRRAASRLN